MIWAFSAGVLPVWSDLVEEVFCERPSEHQRHFPVLRRRRHRVAQLPAIYVVIALEGLRLVSAARFLLVGSVGKRSQREGAGEAYES